MRGATAKYYDLIYEAAGKDYAQESADIRQLIDSRRPGARRLLDVACGTGGHLRHLRQWYEVKGVDLDPSMLDEARLQLPDVPLAEADMRTLELGERFDAVVCLFSSIGYMRSTKELAAATSAMARHLEPGGVLVLDGWVRPDAWIDGGLTTVETARAADVTVVRLGRSARQGATTTLELHHLIATDDGIEHVVDHHELTLFTPDDYVVALQGAGLAVETAPCPMPERDRYVGVRAH
jgi:SAM-dependent methyltransferase